MHVEQTTEGRTFEINFSLQRPKGKSLSKVMVVSTKAAYTERHIKLIIWMFKLVHFSRLQTPHKDNKKELVQEDGIWTKMQPQQYGTTWSKVTTKTTTESRWRALAAFKRAAGATAPSETSNRSRTTPSRSRLKRRWGQRGLRELQLHESQTAQSPARTRTSSTAIGQTRPQRSLPAFFAMATRIIIPDICLFW